MDNYSNYTQHLRPLLDKKDFHRVVCGYLISMETVYLQDIY